jgi:hypothetical protein
MLERVEGDDKKAARRARGELQTLFLNGVAQFLRIALGETDGAAKQWSCQLLANLFVGIGKHVGKVRIEKPHRRLWQTVPFRDTAKKVAKLRTDILFPGLICGIVQGELKRAECYRKQLLILKGVVSDTRYEPAPIVLRHKDSGKELKLTPMVRVNMKDGWQQAAKKHKIPEEYWPAMKLPEFSEETVSRWWKFLWPLIKKNSNQQELLKMAQRKFSPARKRCFSDLQKTARDHLKALARLRTSGVF